MERPILTRELLDRGFLSSELSQLVDQKTLVRLRRGVYTPPGERTAEETHRLLITATLPIVSPEAVVSHGSAAVLHDLPIWPSGIQGVHLLRARRGGSRRHTDVIVHGAPVRPADVVAVAGISTTSVARTVVDLGRTRPFEQAVAAADRALATGRVTAADLRETVDGAKGWRGAPAARRVVAFASPLAESAGVSVSRVRIDDFGLPAPVPQFKVVDRTGRLVGRTDFGWPELKTVGEFDGRVKYGRLLRPGETAADAVYREKLREDALRDLGWQVVRWTWDDLAHWAVVADRLWRAFARSAR